METPFYRVITSPQFTFCVGPEKKPIGVHGAAFAPLSRAFDAMINGQTDEAKAGSACIEDVGEDEFIRLCEFAYTRDFSTPPYVVDAPEVESSGVTPGIPNKAANDVSGGGGERRSPTPEPSDIAWARYASKKKKTVSMQDQRRQSFQKREYCPTLPRQQLIDSYEVVPNSEPSQNYTPVFIAYARLYILSDTYDIESLKSLTLHKLHLTLQMFTLYENRIADIIQLINFVFDNERTNDYGRDELRSLISEYVLTEPVVIGESEMFENLLAEEGPFARDFWRATRPKLQ